MHEMVNNPEFNPQPEFKRFIRSNTTGNNTQNLMNNPEYQNLS